MKQFLQRQKFVHRLLNQSELRSQQHRITSYNVCYTKLLRNDTDDGSHDSLYIESVTSGTGGTAVLNSDGTVTFTPNADFNGSANFTYTVSDGLLTSDAATVNVTVNAVADIVDDTATTNEDTRNNFV